MHRGAVHAGRQARAAIPGRARRIEGARPRNDDLLSHRDVRACAARDRIAAACQSRRDDARGDRRPARGDGEPGHHAGVHQRAALQAGRRSLRFSGQTSRSQAGNPASGRRTEGSVHDRHPDRHRRDTRRADRRAGGDTGSARRPWSYPGSHRPELPGQARHQARQFRGTRSRRPAVDHRDGAPRFSGPT